MTSPGVTPRDFTLFSASVLGWIVWLSYALKSTFGASVSGGWLAAGMLFSLIAIGIILILWEIVVAVEDLKLRKKQIRRELAKTARPDKSEPIRKSASPQAVVRRTTGEAYRIALGLKPRISAANRRRSGLFSARRALRLQSA